MAIVAEIGSSWAGVLVLAGLIAIVFTLGRLLRRHGAREGGGPPGVSSGRGGGPEAEAHLRQTAGQLMADIEAVGREARGEVETRLRVLAELLARADTVIDELDGAEPVPAPPRFEEVYGLADGGLEAAAIAERTSFERGEVELILSLRTRTTASGRLGRVDRDPSNPPGPRRREGDPA